MATVHGAPLSPFVRKVSVGLKEKGIDYELNPMIPIPPANEDPKFLAMSPLGKIPAFEDGKVAISDSSVILAYLERSTPAPALYPSDPVAYARALWLEEYADTRLIEGIGTVFFEKFVGPAVMKRDTDQAKVDEALNEKIPATFDYLESQMDGDHLVGSSFSIADLSVGCMLRQFRMLGEQVDGGRWPKLAAYADNVLGRASFSAVAAVEDQAMAGMKGKRTSVRFMNSPG